MYKVMHLVKRKPHLTHEQFREHFERSHAPMALKFCGHLFSGYRRNYINQVLGGGDPRTEGSGFGPMEWNWDLISEWILPDAESFDKICALMETPELKHLFEEDEDRFIERKQITMMPCTEVCDYGAVFHAEGTVFDTPTGEPSWDWAKY
jgi:hypothetical protein